MTNSSPPPSDYNAAGSYHQGQAAAAAAAAAALAAELSSLHSLAAQGAAGAGLSRLSSADQQAYFRALPSLAPRYTFSLLLKRQIK